MDAVASAVGHRHNLLAKSDSDALRLAEPSEAEEEPPPAPRPHAVRFDEQLEADQEDDVEQAREGDEPELSPLGDTALSRLLSKLLDVGGAGALEILEGGVG